jgi:hypothetical protein
VTPGSAARDSTGCGRIERTSSTHRASWSGAHPALAESAPEDRAGRSSSGDDWKPANPGYWDRMYIGLGTLLIIIILLIILL